MSKWPEGTIIYSTSAFKDVKQCPAKRFFAKEAREGRIKEDPAIAAVVGSAIHLGIEERFKYERNPMTVAKLFMQENLFDKFDARELDQKELIERTDVLDRCIKNFENHYFQIVRDELTDPLSQVELELEIPWRKGWLVGKVDIALPHMFGDWKTSPNHPKDKDIEREIQHQLYYYMAAKLGLPLPEVFRYVYLYGFNEARKTVIIERGPNKGKERVVADNDNPVWHFDFDAKPTKESVNSTLLNQVIPLARILEEKIVYKNPSQYNCAKCKYRTVCPDYKLPTASEYQELLLPEQCPSSI